MTFLTILTALLQLFAVWAQTPDGTNAIAAMICGAALLRMPGRIVLFATLLIHLALILA